MSLGEIIGPVMVGPSSSHTAGAARIGSLAASCFGKTVVRAEIYLRGSFASTAKGHGTDKAILAGILGMAPDNIDLKNSFQIADGKGLAYSFHSEHMDGAHPNSARLVLWSGDGASMEIEGASVGGGAVVIEKIDGFAVRISGDLPTLVTFHEDVHGVVAKVTALLAEMKINIASLVLSRKSRSGQASMVIELDSAISEDMLKRILSSSNAIARAFVLPVKGDEC
jgi:L-serine dehydratase